MIPLILTATVATATVAHTEVWIETTPPGALIFIDAKRAGQAPLLIELPRNAHVIGAELGSWTGAYILSGDGARETKRTIALFAPKERSPDDIVTWRPSWRGALLGASLIGTGAGLTQYENGSMFLSVALVLSGALVSALSIGIGE